MNASVNIAIYGDFCGQLSYTKEKSHKCTFHKYPQVTLTEDLKIIPHLKMFICPSSYVEK